MIQVRCKLNSGQVRAILADLLPKQSVSIEDVRSWPLYQLVETEPHWYFTNAGTKFAIDLSITGKILTIYVKNPTAADFKERFIPAIQDAINQAGIDVQL